MPNESFMDKFRIFFGLRQEPPRNDFRNPIWTSDDEDDGDELYTKPNLNVYTDPSQMHEEFSKHMQDMFKSFGSLFGDMKIFLNDDLFEATPGDTNDLDAENFNSKSIRDYYLKPGYLNRKDDYSKKDIDLDGKISSNEMSGLLKQNDGNQNSGTMTPFNGNMVPGRSFCKTIITTSHTKPDGTVETKRIIKNGNDVIEETTTTSIPGTSSDFGSSMDAMTNTNLIYSSVMSELSSIFQNFY